MTDPAAIAAGLTKAQRDAVAGALRGARNGWWAFSNSADVLDAMPASVCHRRIDPLGHPHVARLTPLGLAVRAALHDDTVRGEGENGR